VAVVGGGRVGTALGALLERAGHRVVAVFGRAATQDRARRWLPRATILEREDLAEALADVDLVVLSLPDDAVASFCRLLAEKGAFRAGRHAVHVSGALGLDALAAARSAGASVLSLHPLQSFPDVESGIERLPGSGIAVTAAEEETARFGERLARDLGGRPFRVADMVKPLYHSAAVFAANYLVTVQATAERLFRLAGIADPAPLFEPLARANLDATFARGPTLALTGPAVRGDAGTIARNAEALADHAPEALPAYLDLARLAARIAEEGGRLSPGDRRIVEEELGRW
jgi:predicted short-subunit dehydrogenase-like oxidoreductase (DUF2520 family)